MITTEKILTIKKTSPRHHQQPLTKKLKIEARWQVIDGKLVCKWVTS